MRFCSGENENGVGRRFLECLQECIESTAREHVNFVDDIYFIFGSRRQKHDFVADPTDIVDTVVGGGIHFDDIHKRVVKNTPADFAFIARIAILRIEAVDRARKDLRNGGLAGAACARKKIGMSDLSRYDGLAEGCDDVFLLDDLVKISRSKLPVQRNVTHMSSS